MQCIQKKTYPLAQASPKPLARRWWSNGFVVRVCAGKAKGLKWFYLYEHWFSQKEDGNSFGIRLINMVPTVTYNLHSIESAPHGDALQMRFLRNDGGGVVTALRKNAGASDWDWVQPTIFWIRQLPPEFHDRVARRNFPFGLSQNRAWNSRLTRLFMPLVDTMASKLTQSPSSSHFWLTRALLRHVSPFAPFPLQKLHHYYELICPCALHRYSGLAGSPLVLLP